MKYLRVADGNNSNASGLEFKINEIMISDNWNPKERDPKLMGGFNFSVEDKILRWLHRGDTIYDVEIPEDAEIIDCESKNCPHGVFRANKIILRNPRIVTEDMVLDLYLKSNLPEKTYYQCIVVLLYRNYLNVAKRIIKDRINVDNIDECIEEFEKMITDKHDENEYPFIYEDLWEDAKEVYDILKIIQSEK